MPCPFNISRESVQETLGFLHHAVAIFLLLFQSPPIYFIQSVNKTFGDVLHHKCVYPICTEFGSAGTDNTTHPPCRIEEIRPICYFSCV